MTEAGRKLVVDRQGVTIVGDKFQFSTSATPSALMDPDLEGLVADATGAGEMESVITGLQSMTKLSYGQYCGLARAVEILGERWSMLLVRDLLVEPKTLATLQRGFARIPADTLLARITELEHGGVVQRRPGSEPGTEVYELTEYGLELDDIAVRLGHWGARLLGEWRPEDTVTANSLVMTLRVAFQPEAARGRTVSFQVEIAPLDIVFHGAVRDGLLMAGLGPVPGGADLVIEPLTHLRGLLKGTLDPDEAVRDGKVRVQGDPALLRTFTEIFRMPAALARPEN
jgi:DNA-binding HxlR family transcriptional regulator